MAYEWWLAKRYIWSKRRHPFVGVVSTISMLGILVGVAALIVVLAVMNGFDGELKSRIIGMRAHVSIEKEGAFLNWKPLAKKIEAVSVISGVSPYIEGQAFVQRQELGQGVLVRGIDPAGERRVSKFYDYLIRGNLTNDARGIVVGQELAKRLNLTIGSEVSLLAQGSKKPFVCRVQGVFVSGMYDYDANLIFMNIPTAQELFEMPNRVSGLSLFLKNSELAGSVKKSLHAKLPYPYYVNTWMDMNKTLFGALKLEKTVMFLILALIILVACLNIAGSLTIMVMDKTKDIGILRALGATPFSVQKIFALDGLMIGSFGAFIGLMTGFILCTLLKTYPIIPLPPEIYYMEKLPVQMDAFDTLSVVSVAVILSFVSSVYPAVMAGKLQPAKALRYE